MKSLLGLIVIVIVCIGVSSTANAQQPETVTQAVATEPGDLSRVQSARSAVVTILEMPKKIACEWKNRKPVRAMAFEWKRQQPVKTFGGKWHRVKRVLSTAKGCVCK